MSAQIHTPDGETAHSSNTWLETHGPAWAERVRPIYGDAAEDVLAMVLGGAA